MAKTTAVPEVAAGLGVDEQQAGQIVERADSIVHQPQTRTRARRSDAGKPRKPAEPPAGKLSPAQAEELSLLIASKEGRRIEWDAGKAEEQRLHDNFLQSCAELDAFITDNTAH
jgi:hypothetical protein